MSVQQNRPGRRNHPVIVTAWHKILVVSLAASLLAGCASGPMPGSSEAMLQSRAAAQSYRLGAGDKVHIAVFNESNLSGDYTIAPDGKITLPLAGEIPAAGKTLPELQQAVTVTL